MPIEVTYNPHVIYVHVLHNDDPERTRRLVARLESLSVAVLGGPEALAAVEHPLPWPPPPPAEKPDVVEEPEPIEVVDDIEDAALDDGPDTATAPERSPCAPPPSPCSPSPCSTSVTAPRRVPPPPTPPP